MDKVSFWVSGVPISKGSMSAFVIPGSRRAILTDQKRKELKPWEAHIGALARESCVPLFDGPVRLELTFAFVRPKGHFGTGKNAGSLKGDAPEFKTSYPDVDKASRAVMDALKDIAYRDDAQVAQLVATKLYVNTTEGGVRITISRAFRDGSAPQ